MKRKYCAIAGVGSALPKICVSNAQLASDYVKDTSDAWIRERTGIVQRYIAGPEETTSSLGLEAAKATLENAGWKAEELDLLVLATTTPDRTFPATAVRIQNGLGMTQGAAFDVQSVCSGFVYALTVTESMMRTGQAKRALIIGAETFSRLLNWEDRTTAVLFGDGAGAMALELADADGEHPPRGILANRIFSDGRLENLLYVDGGPSLTQTTGYTKMKGREVFQHAVTKLSQALLEALDSANLTVDDVDWIVPHQANQRILSRQSKKLGIAESRIVSTVAQHANTSAASIPLAFDVALKDGRIKPGQIVVLEAIGGGLSWGATVLRF